MTTTTPFYQKALRLFTKTQSAQIKKGLAKYPEPFNPHNWTPEELLNHALEESVDLVHYLVGLKELLDTKDKQIQDWIGLVQYKDKELKKYKDRCLDYERKLNVLVPKHDLNYNPPYFDQDDK
jgi:hypothetical protein